MTQVSNRITHWLLAAAFSMGAVTLGAAPVRAGLVIQVNDSTAPAGGTGSFDVSLSDTGGIFNVAGFSAQLSVPGTSGISFTSVDTNTTVAPYIFGTLQSPPFSFDTFPNNQFTASGSALSGVTLNPGDTFGLAHVSYSVASGTPPGPVVVSLLDIGGGTSLSDENGGLVDFTPENGTINVTVAGVPEPSSLVLLGLGAAISSWCLRRKRLAPDRHPVA